MLALVVHSRLHPRPMPRRHPTSRHCPDPSSAQPDSPRNLCVLSVSALDCSPLGFPLNLQLSTFNRILFPFSPSASSVPSVVKTLSFLISPPATRHFSSAPAFPRPCFAASSKISYTLSFSVCSKSFVCHSYENCRGVYQQFPKWNQASDEDAARLSLFFCFQPSTFDRRSRPCRDFQLLSQRKLP